MHYRVAHWAWERPAVRYDLAARLPRLSCTAWWRCGRDSGSLLRRSPARAYTSANRWGDVNGDAVLAAHNRSGMTIGAGRGERRGSQALVPGCTFAPGAKLISPITVGEDVAVGASAGGQPAMA